MTRLKRDSNPGSSTLETDALAARPTRRSVMVKRKNGVSVVASTGPAVWWLLSQGPICSDNFTCCHTEIEVADPTFYLTQSQYTDTGLTSPSTDPITPGAWQGSHWSANVEVTDIARPGKTPSQTGFEPRIFRSRGVCLNR